MAFSRTEQEAIVLYAVWDMIDGMVNFEIFTDKPKAFDAQLTFQTATHRHMFNVLLADFLSKPAKGTFDLPEANGSASTDHTYLFYLRQICDAPLLGPNADSLRPPVENFVEWLEERCVAEKVWFPSIEVQTDISIQRILFIKICGDIAKHNFSRLDRNVDRLIKILRENDIEIDEGQGFVLLPEFYDWFHNNIFAYHATMIAEHLNNIRWGIFEYLLPEFARSFEIIDAETRMYKFNFPENCQNALAQAMYWNLMNQVRSRPWFPKFETSQFLRCHF